MSRLPAAIKRVVCYVRKSREDEEAELRGEDTLAKQRDMLVQDVLSRYDVAYDIAEEVASGDSIAQRPVFRALLPRLGSTYQAIVCKDLSRLGRGSYKDMGAVYDTVRSHRVFIITKDAVYDPANFSDLRMIRFSLFFHREEYEMTLWRLTEGKYDGAARGKWVAGSVPFGYQYNAQTQRLDPLPHEADIVRLIFRWRALDGLGYRAIAGRLTELGLPTPRGGLRWHPEVVRRIVHNPAYGGTLVFRRTRRDPLTGRVSERPAEEHIVVPDAVPPLVDRGLWSACNPPSPGRGAEDAVPVAKPAAADRAELTGLVHCGWCERLLVRQAGTQKYRRRDGRTSLYRKEFLYCPHCHYAVKYGDCEAQLRLVLRGIPLSAPALRQALAAELAQREAADQTVQAAATQRDSLWRKRLSHARMMLLDGVLSPAEYRQIKEDYEAQVEAMVTHADTQRERRDAVPDFDWAALQTLADVYERVRGAAARRDLLAAVFAHVALERTEKGRGRNRPGRFRLTVKLRPGVTFAMDGWEERSK